MSSCTHDTMTNNHDTGIGAGVRIWAGVSGTLHLWRQRYRAREELSRWSDRELHDVGLSYSDIAREVAKPFWRA